METNPTSPNHVRALIELSSDLAAVTTKINGALRMATDPSLFLDASDIAPIRSKLSEILGRVKAFEVEVRSAERTVPVRAVRLTVSDLDPAAIERLLSSACACEPPLERARRVVG